MHELGDRLKQQYLEQLIGSSAEVLWERGQVTDNGNRLFEGYTRNFFRIKTEVPQTMDLENQLLPVKIIRLDQGSPLGELIQDTTPL
jgi:threonylcarbamoyladenosine tRNA methylthiotransferase MtaB